jgi:UDP-N-acetylmuramoyl-tripeptide--D-alanyl-D-alanine ligase
VGRVDVVVGVGPLAAELVEGARAAGFPAEALSHYADAEAASRAVLDLAAPGDALLVKASRGVRLERVVDALAARFKGPAAGGER